MEGCSTWQGAVGSCPATSEAHRSVCGAGESRGTTLQGPNLQMSSLRLWRCRSLAYGGLGTDQCWSRWWNAHLLSSWSSVAVRASASKYHPTSWCRDPWQTCSDVYGVCVWELDQLVQTPWKHTSLPAHGRYPVQLCTNVDWLELPPSSRIDASESEARQHFYWSIRNCEAGRLHHNSFVGHSLPSLHSWRS